MKQHGVLLLTHEIKMSLFDNLDKPHGQSLTEDNEIPPLDHFPPNDYGSMRWWASHRRMGSPRIKWISFPLETSEYRKENELERGVIQTVPWGRL